MWTGRQRKTVLTAAALAMASLLPVILSLWLAQHQASVWFYRQLDENIRRVASRVYRVSDQVRQSLDELALTALPSCSVKHLQQLQYQVYTRDYIEEIFVTDGDRFLCSTLGRSGLTVSLSRPDWQGQDGLQVWFAARHIPDMRHPMLAVARGRYLAVVDPHSLTDLSPGGAFPVAVSVTDHVRGVPVAGGVPVQDGMAGRRSRHLPGTPFVVTASASPAYLYKQTRRMTLCWLPGGLLAAGLILWLMVRFLRRAFTLQNSLAEAIDADAFRVCYQPMVDLGSGECTGAEALLRWPQPDGTFISPEVFIPLAEQTGLITRVTLWVVTRVLGELGEWLTLHPDRYVSVNLSPADLDNPVLADRTAALLQMYGVAPRQLAFEVTERVAADPEKAAAALQRYRQAGHRILLDDFGSGYSSLSWLQSLPVDELKLDKSFLQSGQDGTVVKHVTDMARAMRLTVTAEGIEDEWQARRLWALGVDRGQGWLYSRALSAGEFMAWVQTRDTGEQG